MQRQARRGYAVLMLLVVVAIGMVIYYMSLTSMWGPIEPEDPTKRRPWLEEERLVKDASMIKLPKAPKPVLDSAFSVKTDVRFEQVQRGRVQLDITPDGKIVGDWGCSYSSGDDGHKFSAVFSGNVDAGKTYRDENQKKDKSRLYFICKGDYTEETAALKTGISSMKEGVVYVTGWMLPDRSITGFITITTDKSWSVNFDFGK